MRLKQKRDKENFRKKLRPVPDDLDLLEESFLPNIRKKKVRTRYPGSVRSRTPLQPQVTYLK